MSEEVARSFANQSRERERASQLTLMARLLPFAVSDAFTFMDLGAGTGAATRAVLTEYPRAQAVLAEDSPQMTAGGERRMAPFAGGYMLFAWVMCSQWCADTMC